MDTGIFLRIDEAERGFYVYILLITAYDIML